MTLLSGTVDWALSSAVHGIAQYIQGVMLCWNGVTFAVTHESTTSKSVQWLGYTIIMCIAIYIAALIVIYIPSQIALYVLHRYLTDRIYHTVTYYLSPTTMFYCIFYALPVAVIFLLNNFYHYETIFLDVIRDLDLNLYQAIEHHKRITFTASLYHSVIRNSKLLLIGGSIAVLRLVPVIGSMVPTLWSLRYSYSMYRLHAERVKVLHQTATQTDLAENKTKFLLLLLALYLIVVNLSEHAASIALTFLSVELTCRALIMELFDAALSRTSPRNTANQHTDNTKLRYELNDSKSVQTTNQCITARQFLILHHWQLLGLVSPIVLLCCIPLLGTFVLCIAHTTAAYAMVKLMQRSKYTLQ